MTAAVAAAAATDVEPPKPGKGTSGVWNKAERVNSSCTFSFFLQTEAFLYFTMIGK